MHRGTAGSDRTRDEAWGRDGAASRPAGRKTQFRKAGRRTPSRQLTDSQRRPDASLSGFSTAPRISGNLLPVAIKLASLQLRVLRLGLLQDGDVRVGVFPEGEKFQIRVARLRSVALDGVGAGQLQPGERPGGRSSRFHGDQQISGIQSLPLCHHAGPGKPGHARRRARELPTPTVERNLVRMERLIAAGRRLCWDSFPEAQLRPGWWESNSPAPGNPRDERR